MPIDYSTLVEAFLAGAFPWISQMKNLDIHFKISSFNLKSIFNFFASLFSISIYLYIDRLGKYDLLYWPDWEFFIIISFLLTLIYLTILIYKQNMVNSGTNKLPIIINFTLYILIFCNLTSGFGLLNTYKDYYVFKGVVVNEKGESISKASVTVNSQNEKNINTLTDLEGEFSFLIPKIKAEKYNQIIIIPVGYHEYDLQFGDISTLKTYSKQIIVKKIEE